MIWICLGAGILAYLFFGIRAYRNKDWELEVKNNVFFDLLEVALSIFRAA